MNKKEIVKMLTLVKKENKFTNLELTKKTGVSVSTITKLFSANSEYVPTQEILERIAKGLDLNKKVFDFTFDKSCLVVDIRSEVQKLLKATKYLDVINIDFEEKSDGTSCLYKSLQTAISMVQGERSFFESRFDEEERIKVISNFVLPDDYVYFINKIVCLDDFMRNYLDRAHRHIKGLDLRDKDLHKKAVKGYTEFKEGFDKLKLDFFREGVYQRVIALMRKDKGLANKIVAGYTDEEILENEFFVKYLLVCYLCAKTYNWNKRFSEQSDIALCALALRSYFTAMIPNKHMESCIF